MSDVAFNGLTEEQYWTLTDEQRAAARRQHEEALAQITDAELRASVIDSFERTMLMTWQERRERMTGYADDVIVEIT